MSEKKATQPGKRELTLTLEDQAKGKPTMSN